MDDHTIAHHVVTGGNELALALDLDAADAAGGDLVQVFEIAQAGDFDIDAGCGVQDCRSGGNRNRNIIDRKVYLLDVRPPLKMP